MKAGTNIRFSLASFVLVVATAGCRVSVQSPPNTDAASRQQPPFTEGRSVTVPASTLVFVKLQEPLTSTAARVGQSFAALLDEPLVVDGQNVAPEGTAVTGSVVAVRESGRLRKAGYLRITLTSLMLNGRTVPFATTSVFVAGGNLRNYSLSFTGAGAGGGPLSETLAGGARTSERSGRDEVGFQLGQRLGFRLTQPLSLQSSN